jgi:aspartyl/asparaginyl beta-hydroxylase (cupin superfamily)
VSPASSGVWPDDTAQAIVVFLRSRGAANLPHARGRSLLEHLIETAAIVRRWGQPPWLGHAALLHSVYGTDAYGRRLLSLEQREEAAKVAGRRAERLAYLFGVTPRGPLLAGTYRWAHGTEASRDELDCVVLLHMANLADQACEADGSPGHWLNRLREIAELLIDSDVIELPLLVADLATCTDDEERGARAAYLTGLADRDAELRASRLALAAAACPVLAEPCVWLSALSWSRGDPTSAKSWAQQAQRRLNRLGTAWDKRLTLAEWDELAERTSEGSAPAASVAVSDPRALYDAVASGEPARSRADMPASRGATRFQRYLETLADAGTDCAALGGVYPDLPSRPWHDPRDFPLARYLESRYATIREELSALAPSSFQRESERIERSGDWDVAFFYERGRRNDAVCDACPVTVRGIEAYGGLRTMAGLSYASRMRAGTHIAAHRGPTNLRLRCHLGIDVPDGDCAIRVGEETRRWQAGRCLVFDDHFEHEAWNHADADRVVLIVDIWHPGLSGEEIRLLEALHRHVDSHARNLSRYWSRNAAARAGGAGE